MSITDTLSSLSDLSVKWHYVVSCFLNYMPLAAVLGQNLRGAPGFQTGRGCYPALSGWEKYNSQMWNILGISGAKKRSSWLDVAKILGPQWCQVTVSGMFCFCCGPNNKVTMYRWFLCSRQGTKAGSPVLYSFIPSVLEAFNPLNHPER